MKIFLVWMSVILLVMPEVYAKKKSKKGKISIVTSDIGAKIFIDGVQIGVTPLNEPIVIDPGTYKLKISKKGYFPFETEVHVKAGKTEEVFVELIGASGVLYVEGLPGSKVYVNNKLVGTIGNDKKFEKEIPVGKNSIQVAIKGAGSLFKTIDVKPGKVYKFTYFPTISMKPLVKKEKKKRSGAKKWYKKWWIWGVGGAVITAGVLPFVLSGQGGEPTPNGEFVIK